MSQLLRGQRVWLSALGREDTATIAGWDTDSAFLRLLDSAPAAPRSEDEVARWLESVRRAHDYFAFGIRLVGSDDLIGWLELDGIQWNHQTCGLGIGIGSWAHRGQGYGTQALTLALDFAFYELNLHRVTLTVFAYNHAAIGLYEKLGFVREGVYREHLHRDGQRYDMLLYGLLRREWAAAHPPIPPLDWRSGG
jgi:RimJ/RimL family protein N-acetyltransferase